MSIGLRKNVIGILTTLVLIVLTPLVFWLIARELDSVFKWGRVVGSPASQILGAASILIGLFWISWAYSYLLFVGKGLPVEVFGYALHPTKILVTTGPYAYTRNPMVLGDIFILLGVAFLMGTIGALALIPAVVVLVLLYLVAFEEPQLLHRFGDDYRRYRSNVSLLFPRLTAYIHQPAGES